MHDAVIGRYDELARAGAVLDALPAGPTALLLAGEAGIGKTTLVRAVAEDAISRGHRVLACRPAQAERAMSFAAVADLLGAVPGDVFATLPPPQRHGLDVALLRTDPGGGVTDPRIVGAGVLSVLAGLAERSPVVLVVDDAQWVDGASSAALAFACRRLGDRPIGVVAAARTPDSPEVPFGLERALEPARRSHVTVGPLPLVALHRLIQDRHGVALPRPLLVRIAKASGGNPFFALEIAGELRAGQLPGPGDALPMPESLRSLTSARLTRLSAATRTALLVVAAAAHPTPRLVERIAPGGMGGDVLGPAERRGILARDGDHLRFTHPLLASAVYGAASVEERRWVHRRLGEVVDDLEQRARHRALGSDGPDRGVARLLEDAAIRARARLAAETASDLAAQAQRLTPPDRADDLRRRAILEADCRVEAGDVAGASRLLRAVDASLGPGVPRAEALWRLGNIETVHGNVAEGWATLVRAVENAGGDHALAAAIARDLAYTSVLCVDTPGAVAYGRRAVELAALAGDPILANEARTAEGFAAFLDGGPLRRDVLERAADGACREHHIVTRRPNLMVGMLLMWADDLDAARGRLEAEYRHIVERGVDAYLPDLLALLSQLEAWAGNWDRAANWANDGFGPAALTGQEVLRSHLLGSLALVEAHRGRDGDARAAGEEGLAIAERHGSFIGAIFNLRSLGFLELSRGDHAAAHRHFERLTTLAAPVAAAKAPDTFHFVPDAVETLVALGRLDEATAVLDPFEAQAAALARSWATASAARCRGLLAAARGDLRAALEGLASSLVAFDRLPYPFERGRTLLAKGQMHRRAKEKRAARDALQGALAVFERLGAPVWAETARVEVGRLGLRPAAPADLTATEARVAELAATGLTNREIGRTAFLSPKSVEGVLERVYAKLGIHSRAELGMRMAGRRAARGE